MFSIQQPFYSPLPFLLNIFFFMNISRLNFGVHEYGCADYEVAINSLSTMSWQLFLSTMYWQLTTSI
jgi:hypothetical protein